MKPQNTEPLEGFRLSPQQRRLWGLMQQRDSVFYCQCTILLGGALRRERLENALQQLVSEHEILRTNFQRTEGLGFPVQVIAAEAQVVWDYRDLIGMSDTEQRALVNQLSIQDGERPAGPQGTAPLKATLFALTPSRHELVFTIPALRADKGALARMMVELARSYEAGLSGVAEQDENGETVQYADLAEVFNELLAGDESRLGREHWAGEAEVGAARALPYGRRLPAGHRVADFQAGSLSFQLGAGLSQAVTRVCGEQQVSRESFYLGCWELLVRRLAGAGTAEAEVTGVLMAGRQHAEVAEAVGLLARYVPLRLGWREGASFAELVKEVEQKLGEGRAWQEYFTLGEVSEERVGGAEEAAGELEYWAVSYQYSGAVAQVAVAGGVSFELRERRACLEPYVLELEVEEAEGGGVKLRLNYDSGVYEREEVERLVGQYARLVASATEQVRGRAGELELLSAAERERVLVEWNGTKREYGGEAGVVELFAQQAERNGEREAVVSEAERVSYGELNGRANRLAHYLRGRGVGPETMVGVLLERGVGMITAVLAVLKAGAAFVPLDPDSPKPRLKFQLEDTRARVLITEERLAGELADFTGVTVCLDRDRASLDLEAETNPSLYYEEQQLAYVIYTSGSTGHPKGVAISHGSLANYTRFICEELEPDNLPDCGGLNFALVSTITADLGNTVIFPSLVSGGCLHVLGHSVTTDSVKFAGYFARQRIDVLKIVPAHLNALLSSQEGAQVLPAKYLFLGGEAFSFDLLRRIEAAGGTCQVINHYGPTETTVGALTFSLDRGIVNPKLAATVPIGRPIANTKTYVVDHEMNPVGVGMPGELWIGGAGLARGYLNRPDLTAERLVPDHFGHGPSGRLYRTGDRVRYLADGNIEFLGRIDQQVKIRGFRVEPGEIEVVLSRHETVREAAVVAREDVPGEKKLVAYVVGRETLALSLDALRSFLERELPSYMVPSAIVQLPALPLTSNGKLDRRRLPAPVSSSSTDEKEFVAPENRMEKVLADIWSQVLGLERIGVHDNFFQLGGDSIVSIQIAAKAHRAGIPLAPLQLFQHPTINKLALALGASHSPTVTAESAMVPAVVSAGGHSGLASSFPQVKLDERQLELILKKMNKH